MPHYETWKDFNVLIVDDDPVYQELVVGMLEMIGFTKIKRAENGRSALIAIRSSTQRFDLIICDCQMATGNGLQLLQYVRTGETRGNLRPDCCFILLTSLGQSEVVRMAQQLDVSGYVIKPVTVEKLVDAIAKGRARAFPLDINRYKAVVVPENL